MDAYRGGIGSNLKFWDDSGLLEGLDMEMKVKLAYSMTFAAEMIYLRKELVPRVMRNCDNDFYFYESESFETVIFPIIRYVVTKHDDAYKYIALIFKMAMEKLNSEYYIGVTEGDENYRRHYLDVRHREASIKMGKEPYFEGGYDGTVERMNRKYGEFSLDWEAEITWCVAAEITHDIKKMIGDE